ncbi:MAG: metal-sensitive transcriptional regulator [Bacteroidia bacterium]
MHIEHETKSDIIKRSKRLAGQINGIQKMLNQNRDASDILILLLSVQGSFAALSSSLDSAFRMHINIILHTPIHLVFQTQEHLQYIENTKVQLVSCTPHQLLQIMYSIKQKKIFPE